MAAKRMSITKFLAILNKLAGPKTFVIGDGQYIRGVRKDHCPISYVANRTGAYRCYGACYSAPGAALGLNKNDILLIVDAADKRNVFSNYKSMSKLRNRLLKACKLA